MSARILLIGARGQVGRALQREATLPVVGLTSGDVDLRDSQAVTASVLSFARAHPKERVIVVNAAGYTSVDGAESAPLDAYAINATAPGIMAAACARVGARFLHLSTDYVFDGEAHSPYEIDAVPAPLSVYGKTKLQGELAVMAAHPDDSFVVRTSWVWGATGNNFVRTMIRLERERPTIDVVNDERGTPTWATDLSSGLLDLAEADAQTGTYHLTNTGETTWYGLAQAVFEELGADPDRVMPTTAARFGKPAPRPAYGVLSLSAWQSLGLTMPRPWRQALADAFEASRSELSS